MTVYVQIRSLFTQYRVVMCSFGGRIVGKFSALGNEGGDLGAELFDHGLKGG